MTYTYINPVKSVRQLTVFEDRHLPTCLRRDRMGWDSRRDEGGPHYVYVVHTCVHAHRVGAKRTERVIKVDRRAARRLIYFSGPASARARLPRPPSTSTWTGSPPTGDAIPKRQVQIFLANFLASACQFAVLLIKFHCQSQVRLLQI